MSRFPHSGKTRHLELDLLADSQSTTILGTHWQVALANSFGKFTPAIPARVKFTSGLEPGLPPGICVCVKSGTGGTSTVFPTNPNPAAGEEEEARWIGFTTQTAPQKEEMVEIRLFGQTSYPYLGSAIVNSSETRPEDLIPQPALHGLPMYLKPVATPSNILQYGQIQLGAPATGNVIPVGYAMPHYRMEIVPRLVDNG